jgi:hypothetical protein
MGESVFGHFAFSAWMGFRFPQTTGRTVVYQTTSIGYKPVAAMFVKIARIRKKFPEELFEEFPPPPGASARFLRKCLCIHMFFSFHP